MKQDAKPKQQMGRPNQAIDEIWFVSPAVVIVKKDKTAKTSPRFSGRNLEINIRFGLRILSTIVVKGPYVSVHILFAIAGATSLAITDSSKASTVQHTYRPYSEKKLSKPWKISVAR